MTPADIPPISPDAVTTDDAQTTAPFEPGPGTPLVDPCPRVPGYEIEGILGRGGMGVVYRARHLALKRAVALKMILHAGHAGEAERARFRAEAEAAARLTHPHIVQVYEVGEHDGRPFCALELVEGGSLAGKLMAGPLPPAEAAKLAEAMARAMSLAHARNVIHRDLKPANVLLTSDGTPKIADFGLARRLDESGQTQAGAVLGTPSYMAPEQAEGRANEAGPAADVWALGAVLYECLTGRPPFLGASVLETLEQVRTREPAPPRSLNPAVPRDLETVCLKCLRKEPERRYASAAELADDLGRFLRGEPVAARPVGGAERLAKWARRRPAVAGLLAALLLAVTVGVAATVHFGLRASAEAERARTNAETADTNARVAEERLAIYEGALVEGALRPLARPVARGQVDWLGPAELPGLLLLAVAPSERVRDRVLEQGLADEGTARRLGRRIEPVVIATVGLSPTRRERARKVALARLADGQAGPEVRRACVLLAGALRLDDEAFPRAALAGLADAALIDRPLWADALATVAERLGPGLARQLAPDVQAALSAEKDAVTRPALARVLAALAGRLPRDEAAALCGPAARQASEAVRTLTGTRDISERFSWYAVLTALTGRLPPEEATAAARQAVHVLAEELGPASPATPMFTDLAGRLGPREAAAAARQAVEDLVAASSPAQVNPLVAALRALAARLPPEEAAAAARVVLVRHLAQVRPTAGEAYGRAAAVLAARAYPKGAADLEAALVVLASAEQAVRPGDRDLLRPTLEALADPTSPAAARRAAEARAALESPLARAALDDALAALASRLTAADADAVCGPILLRSVGELASDKAARATRARAAAALAAHVGGDRADAAARLAIDKLAEAQADDARVALAEPLAVLAARVTPGAAPLLAGQLRDALVREPTPRTGLLLARALTALLGRLDDAAAAALAGPAARAQLDALARTRLENTGARRFHGEALEVLAVHLNATDAATAASRAAGELTRENDYTTLRTTALALAALAGRLAPEEAARVSGPSARLLVGALDRTTDPLDRVANFNARPALAAALAALAGHLPPEQRAAVCAPGAWRLADALPEPNQGLAAVAGRERALQVLAEHLPTPAVADLLKHPLSLGGPQATLLGVLGRRAGRSFADVWEFADWARSQPGINLDAPPLRPG
jgi:hypothetical protein